MYFTDPFYKRPYWENRDQPEQAGQHVYRLDPGSSKAVAVDTDLLQPNGIIGSPDGQRLFVADIGDNKTRVGSRAKPEQRCSYRHTRHIAAVNT